jgi:TolA-binding protein
MNIALGIVASKFREKTGMKRRWGLVAFVLACSTSTMPAIGQSDTTRLRVERLEKEMKAVQRVVFPNGQPIESEINGSSLGGQGSPSASPVADLTARVDALEAQLRSLTGQVEQDGFRIKKLEEGYKVLEAKLQSGEATTAASPPAQKPAAINEPSKPVSAAAAAPAKPAVAAPVAAKPAIAKPATAATPAKADPKRQALIDKVELPATDDPVEDAYSYGYRLWQAKLFPEAQAKLREFSTRYASHRRASYAQNLLGRAYLDEGKPGNASRAFYANYKNNPKGERASESLYWLGISLMKLNEKQAACDAYKEFNTVYGATAAADLKARVAKGRTDAQCAG